MNFPLQWCVSVESHLNSNVTDALFPLSHSIIPSEVKTYAGLLDISDKLSQMIYVCYMLEGILG